ncbi:unnamed protein product [Lymnaea stagnalis]|uniref:EF-hand domain-containing protein n=1 Tax=Lymnaea stagnalis TaxID=6523 RepID=A0AAV2HXM1_LYMST
MEIMKFLGILLISVLPLTLTQLPTQLPALSSLPNFQVANLTFRVIDRNNNGIMELTECNTSFNTFKRYPTDNSIARDWFVARMVSFSHTQTVGDYVFTHYDRDSDNDLDVSDFNAMYTLFDKNGNGVVVREEFIRYYDQLLTNATLSG